MPKMSDIEESIIKHCLVYGPPKSGKTRMVGELSEHFNLHWLDLEYGSDTLKQLPIEWQQRIEVYRIPDSKAFPVAIETIYKLLSVRKGAICAAHGKFNCPLCKKDDKEMWPIDLTTFTNKDILVIDSWTQIVLSAIGNITKGKDADYKLDFDDWGHLKNLMENNLTLIQGAPFHVCVISHEDVVDMIDKTEKIVPVGGSRNTSRNMAKYFGEVIYTEVMNKKHKALSSTIARNNILTGSRSQLEFEKSEAPKLAQAFGIGQ